MVENETFEKGKEKTKKKEQSFNCVLRPPSQWCCTIQLRVTFENTEKTFLSLAIKNVHIPAIKENLENATRYEYTNSLANIWFLAFVLNINV